MRRLYWYSRKLGYLRSRLTLANATLCNITVFSRATPPTRSRTAGSWASPSTEGPAVQSVSDSTLRGVQVPRGQEAIPHRGVELFQPRGRRLAGRRPIGSPFPGDRGQASPQAPPGSPPQADWLRRTSTAREDGPGFLDHKGRAQPTKRRLAGQVRRYEYSTLSRIALIATRLSGTSTCLADTSMKLRPLFSEGTLTP